MKNSGNSSGKGLKIAIAGAGLMGRWHAYTAKQLGAEIVAVIDQDLAAAQKLPQLGAESAYTDLASALTTSQAQVLHICTPLPSHLDLALQALQAGLHVLAEKPLAANVHEVKKIYHEADRAQRLVCPVHQFVFQQGTQFASEKLISLGQVLRVEFTTASAGGTGRAAAEFDNIVAEILPHPLSLLVALWPEKNLTEQWQIQRPRAGEWLLNGQHGEIPVHAYISLHARPTRCELLVYCTGGTLYLDLFHGYATLARGRVSRTQKIVQPFLHAGQTLWTAGANLAGRALRRQTAYPGLYELMQRFYTAIADNIAPPITAQQAIAVAQARDVITGYAYRN